LHSTILTSYPQSLEERSRFPNYTKDEEPIDASDIRKILLNCNNRRLKSYLLILTSGGMRAVEATAIRLKDINFLQILQKYT
jgi:integrase